MELQKYKKNKSILKEIPGTPGVYIFWNKLDKPIYVGKAISLKKRLESYFSENVFGKTQQMITEANSFSIINVSSEIEALLLEAKLVNQLQTKYNSQLKDDKHPLYIRVTKDFYPQVLTSRKKKSEDKSVFYGPFPSATSVRTVLKLIRKVFPYAQHSIGKRACIYSQIGLCDPCPNEIENISDPILKEYLRKTYKRNIFMIKTFLSGNLGRVKSRLQKDMSKFSSNQNFELAKDIREKIKAIEYITQPVTPVNYFLENPNLLEDIRQKESFELTKILSKFIPVKQIITKIECYDVAHMAGTNTTASMVTFVNGEAEKSLYRHFKIRQKRGADDLASLREVAERRLNNIERWSLPDLIVVDGGRGQLKVFLETFKNRDIPIVGLAKREETLILGIQEKEGFRFEVFKLPKSGARNLMQRVRNEAHRFARRYHFNLVKKLLLSENVERGNKT